MANFLGNLGAAFRGQQEYQTFLDQREQAKLKIESDKANLDALNYQRQIQPQINQGLWDTLTEDQKGIQGIGAPPIDQTPQDQPPPVQAPQPGQQSVPMQQPVQYGQRPIPGGPPGPPQGQQGMPPQGPQQGPQQGMGPPPQGMPPGGPQMRPGPPPGPPQGQPQGQPPGPPPVPPYQTVGGGGPPPQMQMGLPPPPAQPQNAPPPNSMSIKDAAKFIKQKGITDPNVAIGILEKLTPYLQNDAKQEVQTYKLQLDQANKVNALNEKIRNDDLIAESKTATLQEKKDAHQSANQTKLILGQLTASIQQQNTNLRAQQLKEKAASTGNLTQDDYKLMAEQFRAGDGSVLTGLYRNPKDLAGVRSEISRQAKEAKESGEDLAGRKAEFEGYKAGSRSLGTRTAQVAVAANEAGLFAKNALAASNKVDRTNYPDFNKILLSGKQKTGDPDVVAFGSYNNSLVNAYTRAVAGTGGSTVSDREHARELLSTGFSKGQYQAAIDVLLKEIEAAKQAPQQAKQELRELASSPGGGGQKTFSSKEELQNAIKSGKIKKGDTFADPSGGLHTVN